MIPEQGLTTYFHDDLNKLFWKVASERVERSGKTFRDPTLPYHPIRRDLDADFDSTSVLTAIAERLDREELSIKFIINP